MFLLPYHLTHLVCFSQVELFIHVCVVILLVKTAIIGQDRKVIYRYIYIYIYIPTLLYEQNAMRHEVNFYAEF